MDYGAGRGNRRNRDGPAPPVLGIHPWGRKTVTDPFPPSRDFFPCCTLPSAAHPTPTNLPAGVTVGVPPTVISTLAARTWGIKSYTTVRAVYSPFQLYGVNQVGTGQRSFAAGRKAAHRAIPAMHIQEKRPEMLRMSVVKPLNDQVACRGGYFPRFGVSWVPTAMGRGHPSVESALNELKGRALPAPFDGSGSDVRTPKVGGASARPSVDGSGDRWTEGDEPSRLTAGSEEPYALGTAHGSKHLQRARVRQNARRNASPVKASAISILFLGTRHGVTDCAGLPTCL
jgi:hypothetical protein